MSDATSALYGSTSTAGSVPGASPMTTSDSGRRARRAQGLVVGSDSAADLAETREHGRSAADPTETREHGTSAAVNAGAVYTDDARSAADLAETREHGRSAANLAETRERGTSAAVSGGPLYTDDGRLVLDESFGAFQPVPDMAWFDAGLKALLASDDFVERWRIWDCYAQSWAAVDLTLYRFETFDLVIRKTAGGVCSWRGALDTQERVVASRWDRVENEQKCWQWLRE